ncbi:MAG TPA: hypothetical protein VJ398_06905 [Acidimicrobiia bacterium]|nr:hypothetical protein [Acidimicrobiia bacterium]
MSGSFVVVYYGNTGSTWLVETLSTSPEVLVPAFEPLEQCPLCQPRVRQIELLKR